MGEREEFVETLGKHRGLLRRTVRDLTDEQAARRTTASELSLGGLIKHVAAVEAIWTRFITGGAEAMRSGGGGSGGEDWAEQFRMAEGETLAGLLAEYERVARETDELVRGLPDLDLAHPLPPAPWFEQGASWSARRVLLHLIAETAQHAGHADIIRESLDGAKSMG
ncbi:DinB family protein [Kitasatospora sp. SUK 42]|uniref:DinB family protein n=1 Tax=Kitasatospora sp. SUK 42 TaxID=1588882 RepID=UPI001C313AF0|nr:DinB family protein [Kitasatospora sp. SUK 42]MBV2153005.1 DinB family protein [Kitasatospora sp. SUK 42]